MKIVQNKIVSNVLFAIAAAILGGVVGALSAAFLRFIDWGQDVLWFSDWSGFAYAPLLLCTLGGVLVGLGQRYFGDHPKDLQNSIKEIGATGRLEYTHLLKGLAIVAVSLIFGASLGPEAAIISLLGGLSTWTADLLRGLRALLHLEMPSENGSRLHMAKQKWANGILLLVAFGIFLLGIKDLYSDGFLKLTESPAWLDLAWSLPLGLLGAGLGGAYLYLSRTGEKVSARFQPRPVIKATLAGLLLGAAATWLPMILFSGQHDLQMAYNTAGQLGAVELISIGVVRLVLVALLLVSGWKGGQFLPLMLASTAVGLGFSQLLPAVSAPTGILAVMSGLLVIILPNPLAALLLIAFMFPWQYLGIVVTAILVVTLAKVGWKHLRVKTEQTQVPQTEIEQESSLPNPSA